MSSKQTAKLKSIWAPDALGMLCVSLEHVVARGSRQQSPHAPTPQRPESQQPSPEWWTQTGYTGIQARLKPVWGREEHH